MLLFVKDVKKNIDCIYIIIYIFTYIIYIYLSTIYLHAKDGTVRLWHLLVNLLYIYHLKIYGYTFTLYDLY